MAVTKFTKSNTGRWNLVAGIIMLLLGVFIWFNPFGTMLALAFYLGIGFVLAGGFYIMSSIDIKSGWYLLVGVLDLIVGLILMANLGVTAASLPIILALWCLTGGWPRHAGVLCDIPMIRWQQFLKCHGNRWKIFSLMRVWLIIGKWAKQCSR